IHKLPSLYSSNLHSRKLHIFDQRERSKFTLSNYINNDILEAIKSNKSDGYQSLLFLNRRGSSRIIACKNCGWQKHCKRCNVTQTFHSDEFLARCHSCGWTDSPPLKCPACNSKDIIYKGIGTKGLVDEIGRLIPGISIIRLDTDVKKTERLEQTFQQIKQGKFDVILGTQMITKGLDLPKLKTVAVISADSSLYMPDFTAEEQTYQLIHQVIGRVGRGHGDAEIFIQTYHPNSKAINFACQNDYNDFYHWQLSERQQYLYPPFVYLLKLTTEAKTRKTVQSRANQLYYNITSDGEFNKVIVSEPSPMYIEQLAGKFRWQLVIRSKQRKILVKIKHRYGDKWRAEFDPVNLL
ncbi:MAG: primosomal protein N', partial [Patescibacteria group bacterium]